MKIGISMGNSRKDKVWYYEEMKIDEFVRRISFTTRTLETVEEYKKLPKSIKDDIKDVGGFVLGKLKDNRRKKDCVINRSALTLDMDYATQSSMEEIEKNFSFSCYFYSTHKHTQEKPRLRLIIPLSREITALEYGAVSRMIAYEIGMELFDDTTYEPSRLMYWPSTSKDGEFIFKVIKGDLLSPDEVLNKYNNWKDYSQWPVSKRQGNLMKTNLKNQENPLHKKGVIGAFCRSYTITEAIENFLSDIYEKSEIFGRYNYIPASSQGGLVIYEDKFAYSHHASDPACGRLVNVFDLVRIHKFGDTDKNSSYVAMVNMAIKDNKVKKQLIEEKLAQAREEFSIIEEEENDNNWLLTLELDKHGKITDTLSNIVIILRNDINLKNIVYNEFKSCIDVRGKLPWSQLKPGWGDADLACAKIYFEKAYGIWSPNKFKDALLGVVSSERTYHPIKEYFSTLKWDNIPRLDRLLIDYLGADDCNYVKAVTRKTICAAVSRIYEPGIKFDSILILNGPQGVGKSTFFSILGKEWYSDSLTISDMKDKTSAEKLQGYWILELGELAGMKKVDVETVKSFITRTDDKFRQSYGMVVESHPRTSIIVGTTNNEGGFLRDVTGNRRFWPIHVNGKGKYKPWDLKDIDQIWAEAIVRYKEGEELYLKGDVAIKAIEVQKQAMESDDREGIVMDYLDKLLPTYWESMDLYERRCYLNGEGFDTTKGSVRRRKVCVMEIWCECFLNERQNLKRYDSYEIETILARIGGWEKYSSNTTGKSKFRLYGIQKTYVREQQA